MDAETLDDSLGLKSTSRIEIRREGGVTVVIGRQSTSLGQLWVRVAAAVVTLLVLIVFEVGCAIEGTGWTALLVPVPFLLAWVEIAPLSVWEAYDAARRVYRIEAGRECLVV